MRRGERERERTNLIDLEFLVIELSNFTIIDEEKREFEKLPEPRQNKSEKERPQNGMNSIKAK
jgi:hypothetical protein